MKSLYTEQRPILTQPKPSCSSDLVGCLRTVSRVGGRSLGAQIRDIARLKLDVGQLGASEYYLYDLWRSERTYACKRRFMGWRMWGIAERRAVPAAWWAVVEDKLVLYALLTGLGFPVPRIHAIYQAGRNYGAIPALHAASEFKAFLRTRHVYPFFGKPVGSGRGVGMAAVRAYSASTDTLVLTSGREVDLDAFAAEVERYRVGGYMIQQLVDPDPAYRRMVGPALSTLRMCVIAGGDQPVLHRAAWRIPAGGNVVDNFSQPGNLLAGIDPVDGRVRRVVTGGGPFQNEVRKHPETGETLTDRVLPGWGPARELCLAAAAALPQIGLQAWDIAVSAEGPVVIEANVAGDVDVPQVANGEGVLDEILAEHFRRWGVKL